MLLTHCRNIPPVVPIHINHPPTPPPANDPCPSIPCLLTSLRKISVPPRFKCLFKIVKCINSVHFKVCLQSIAIVMSRKVLRLIVGNSDAFDPEEFGGSDGEFDVDGSSACQTEEEETSDNCEHRARLLNALVEALRMNRNHWNITVREASEKGLDRLLEVM